MIFNPHYWWVMQIANLLLGYIGLQIRCNGGHGQTIKEPAAREV